MIVSIPKSANSASADGIAVTGEGSNHASSQQSVQLCGVTHQCGAQSATQGRKKAWQTALRAPTMPKDASNGECRLSHLQDALNTAVNDAQHWEEVCNATIRLFGATGAILVPTDPIFRGVWMSGSTDLMATLGEYIDGNWHLRDPRERMVPLMLKHGHANA